MSSYSALCQFPAGAPPDGVTPNFTDPPTYAAGVVVVCALMMAFAIFFTAGRLFANRKSLAWSDYFNLMAVIFSLAQNGLMLAQLKYVRHQWDIPACWFIGDYAKIIFSQQMMLLPGIFCAKTSLFLLFAQIFNIKDDMKIAIRIGLVINFLLYFTGIPVEAYYQAPGIGQKWETLMLTGKQRHAIYWGLVQSAVAIVLDFYIFILPLPVIAQLRISSRKQAKLGAIFSTAFVGVVANILSLFYRVLEFKDTADGTWNLYALLTCSVVELNVAIIVCSVPGFTRFMKTYVAGWSLLVSLRSKFSRNERSSQNIEPSGDNKIWPGKRQHASSATGSLDDPIASNSHGNTMCTVDLPLDSYLDVTRSNSLEPDRYSHGIC